MRHAGMLLSMEWQAAIVTAFADITQQQEQPASDIDCVIAAIAEDTKAEANNEAVANKGAVAAATTAAVLGGEAVAADGVAVITAVGRASGAGGVGSGAVATLRQRHSNSSGTSAHQQKDGTAPAAATGVSAGGSPPHACSHPYNRLCSDCLSSHRAAQGAVNSANKQQQQFQAVLQAAAVARLVGKLGSPSKQQQLDHHHQQQQQQAQLQGTDAVMVL